MKPSVTASMLYDHIACPHRVTMDLYGSPADRDSPNPFVQLLWEKGSIFERETIQKLEIPYLDLSTYAGDEKERLTTEAMQRGEPLIYGGRMQVDGLLGDPDLLREDSGGYIAGDIKSGAGEEGREDLARPKKHYAVQLGLYTDILAKKGLSPDRRAFVWDVHGDEVVYDFSLALGKRDLKTLWEEYQACFQEVNAILEDRERTAPASSGACKLCHWYSSCLKLLSDRDDLTLIPELGRSKRDSLVSRVKSVQELAEIDPESFVTGKKTIFPGIGPDTLRTFHLRAKLQVREAAAPFLKGPIKLPDYDLELFFDLEVDPMRDVCYLHGFVERRGRDQKTERFVPFFADQATAECEKEAFAKAWCYLKEKRPCAIYYYSKYERTIYRKLAEKYSDVCTLEEIEELFDPTDAIDLYFDVVKRATEWPTRDYSIKTLAKYLGFEWRDKHPSGAASIEWFDRWVRTGDQQVRQRILDYNEDDCIATRVLLDGIRALS